MRSECADGSGYHQHLGSKIAGIHIKTADDYKIIHEGRRIIFNPHKSTNLALSIVTVASRNQRSLPKNDRGANCLSEMVEGTASERMK